MWPYYSTEKNNYAGSAAEYWLTDFMYGLGFILWEVFYVALFKNTELLLCFCPLWNLEIIQLSKPIKNPVLQENKDLKLRWRIKRCKDPQNLMFAENAR